MRWPVVDVPRAGPRRASGKTLAFGIPVAGPAERQPDRAPARLTPRALILVPTRELARQVADALAAAGARRSTSG